MNSFFFSIYINRVIDTDSVCICECKPILSSSLLYKGLKTDDPVAVIMPIAETLVSKYHTF